MKEKTVNKILNIDVNKLLKATFWIVIGFSIIFRFSHLDSKVFWHDEVYTQLRISGYEDIEPKQARFGNIISKQDLMKYQTLSPEHGIPSVIKSLSKDTQMPLYYILLKWWQDLWGDSISAIRAFSALFSVLTLPALYLLVRELFNSEQTAMISTILMGISPIFIRYAQEARAYSLWSFSIVISTYLLLQASKVNSNKSWLLYSISIATSSYSQLLSFFVYVGHFIYMACIHLKKISIFSKYLTANLIGIILFSPWLFTLVLPRLESIKGQTKWLGHNIPDSILRKEQITNIAHLFISLDFSERSNLLYLSAIPIVLLVIYSLINLILKSKASVWLIPAGLGLIGIICFYQDLTIGGQRTRLNQYFLSTYIAIFICLGFTITQGIRSQSKIVSNIWIVILIVMTSLSTITNISTSRQNTWWGWSSFQIEMADIINQSENPLVVSQNRIGIVMPLFHRLKDNTQSLMLNLSSDSIYKDIDKYDVFLLNPSPTAIQKYQDISGKKVNLIYKYKDPFVKARLYK